MSASDIKAGRAYVELMLNDAKFVRGLRRSSERLKQWGAGVAKIGAGVMAAGAAITGPLMAAVNHFASAGDKLDKMSQRTGVAASALAELGWAAEQSGADLDTVENSVRRMQKTIGDANRGLGTANDAFNALGLNLAELNAMSPEDQFQAIADRIGEIEDPTKRASAAMQIFGSRQGTALLPMLESLRELRKEAQELGIAPSDESVKKAAEVTDAFNRIYQTVNAVKYEIGYALGDVMLEISGLITNVVVATNRWVKQNHGLVQTIFAVGAGLMVAGTAIVALGGSLFVAGITLGGIATAITAISTGIGILLSPIGLVTAAVVGGVTAWALYTESGQKAVRQVTGSLRNLLGETKTTFTGIYDAIRGGNLQLAGEIAMAGLRIAWLKGLDALDQITGNYFGKITGQLMSGDFLGAFQTHIVKQMDMNTMYAQFLVDIFAKAARAVVEAWRQATTQISSMLLELTADNGPIGAIARQIIGVDLKPGDIRGAQQIAAANISRQADFGQSSINQFENRINGVLSSMREQNAAYMADGGTDRSSAIAAAQAELARLTEAARMASQAARDEEGKRRKQIGDQMEGVGANMPSFVGTFSAAAFSAVGGGNSPMERAAKGIEELKRVTKDGNDQILHELRMGALIT